MFTLLDRLADRTMAPAAFRGVLAATFGKWVFYILAHVVGQSLMTKANSQFALRIRREVMASMLRQDVEFFDRNPSGVLQERLNKDAQELAENLFNEPKMLLRCCAIIVANLFVLCARSTCASRSCPCPSSRPSSFAILCAAWASACARCRGCGRRHGRDHQGGPDRA